jgi:hypothetical protein
MKSNQRSMLEFIYANGGASRLDPSSVRKGDKNLYERKLRYGLDLKNIEEWANSQIIQVPSINGTQKTLADPSWRNTLAQLMVEEFVEPVGGTCIQDDPTLSDRRYQLTDRGVTHVQELLLSSAGNVNAGNMSPEELAAAAALLQGMDNPDVRTQANADLEVASMSRSDDGMPEPVPVGRARKPKGA